MRTGSITIPLHWGQTPPWLFRRMRNLAREIIKIAAIEYGPYFVLQKISDPLWFQALGCILGFDWHSSGLTTTTTAAIKEGIAGIERDLGLYVAGGKGKTSRKTPAEIAVWGQRLDLNWPQLIYNSKMSAKIDSVAVQDGFQLYHHNFFFDSAGNWAVVQQGLNYDSRLARRYHWFSGYIKNFVIEPHAAICCNKTTKPLNLVDRQSQKSQSTITNLARQKPTFISYQIENLKNYHLPTRHQIEIKDINPKRIYSILLDCYQNQPKNFESLLSKTKIGPKTIRALSLIAELIYGAKPSYRDPARFSFAHGGKDGIPYPVDRPLYDQNVQILRKITQKTNLSLGEKNHILKKLYLMNNK